MRDVYIHVHIYVCIRVYVYMRLYTCICIRVHVYMRVYTCICIRVYVYVYMYICVYIRVYVRTQGSKLEAEWKKAHPAFAKALNGLVQPSDLSGVYVCVCGCM